MAKIRITIEGNMDLKDNDYTETYDGEGNELTLTKEQADALTPAERLEHDYRAIKAEAFDISEYLTYGDFENENIKFELLEDRDGGPKS